MKLTKAIVVTSTSQSIHIKVTPRQLHAKYCGDDHGELVLHLSNNTNFWHKNGYTTNRHCHSSTIYNSPSQQTQTSSAPELLESDKHTPALLGQSLSAPSPAWRPPENEILTLIGWCGTGGCWGRWECFLHDVGVMMFGELISVWSSCTQWGPHSDVLQLGHNTQ